MYESLNRNYIARFVSRWIERGYVFSPGEIFQAGPIRGSPKTKQESMVQDIWCDNLYPLCCFADHAIDRVVEICD